MAVVKYDVSDVETGGGAHLQPGLYKGKINAITNRKQKTDGTKISDLEVVVSFAPGIANLWTYIKLPDDPNWSKAAHGWKLREFTDAVGLPSKGGIDTGAAALKKLMGKEVAAKVVADTDQDGDYRGKIKNLLAPVKGARKPSLEDATGGGNESESDDDDAGGEEKLTREELSDWSSDDLREELEARNLTVDGRFSASKAIDAILADEGEDEPEPDDEDEPDPDEQTSDDTGGEIDAELLEDLKADPDYYSDWSDEDLKQYVEDLGISGNISGRKTVPKMIEAVVALAESQNGEGDGEGDDEPTDDYDEWPDSDLVDEIDTRNIAGAEIKIPGRKTKAKMIAALREDDKSSEPF